MFQKYSLIWLLTSLIALTGCASSSSGGKVSIGGTQRTVDFCTYPSDIGTALACEVAQHTFEAGIDGAIDAYKSARRKNTPQKTNSDKELLTELSESEICEGAYGSIFGLASHQYVAKHRKLDCFENYTDENLCKSILKKNKLMNISLHHTNSASLKETIFEMQSEKDRRSLDC